MKRLDKFVNDTALLWFLALVMTVGVFKWLIIWAIYELFMSIILSADEKEENNKRKYI